MNLKETIRHVASQEAIAAGVELADVICMARYSRAVAARNKAMRRIARETGCNYTELAEAWGCGRDVVRRTLIEDPRRATPFSVDRDFIERLVSCHGEDRTRRILQGCDAATNVDIAKWNNLGRVVCHL